MTEYLSLRDVCRRASISERMMRRYLGEIPHYRISPHGRILIRWADFEKWMESRRVQIRRDEDVMSLLRAVAEAS